MKNKFDFAGWATRNDLKCADGKTIRQDAFKDDDGCTVPLVWQHQHDAPNNVLGHALLENRPQGVYAYCVFNNTDMASHAKELVRHGDINAMSIYANKLKQKQGNVLHGKIREVSLVLAGANPGAIIDQPVLSHADGSEVESDEATVYTGMPLELDAVKHSDISFNANKLYQDIEAIIAKNNTDSIAHAAISDSTQKSEVIEMANPNATAQDIFNTLSDEQKEVVYYMIGVAVENAKEEANADMKHNVFESDVEEDVISHADMEAVIADAKRYGSMRESALQHGIENIEYLFPDAQAINDKPDFITENMEWVSAVMDGTRHTPFSRIKSIHADLREDEARAKGYIKGKMKKEEFFALMKRVTTPTTVYKKQKMDRDDQIDITSFDTVAWLKGEMRMKLNEELARAILVGDGRTKGVDDDKIDEACIRPIWTDDALYTVKFEVPTTSSTTEADLAKGIMRGAVKSRKSYRGSGSPVMFTSEDALSDMLLLEDTTGRIIYDSMDKLCNAMRVKKIVTCPYFDNLTRTDATDNKAHKLLALIVNMADYTVGADKGGEVHMFDDFDIDYNQQKYLIETRCSGALTMPYSAIAIEAVPST